METPGAKREVLNVTSEHPLFVDGKGWLEVRKIAVGDRIQSGKGGSLAVVEIANDNKPSRVYNFEVAQDHSYFVGDEEAWSHNPRGGDKKGGQPSSELFNCLARGKMKKVDICYALDMLKGRGIFTDKDIKTAQKVFKCARSTIQK